MYCHLLTHIFVTRLASCQKLGSSFIQLHVDVKNCAWETHVFGDVPYAAIDITTIWSRSIQLSTIATLASIFASRGHVRQVLLPAM